MTFKDFSIYSKDLHTIDSKPVMRNQNQSATNKSIFAFPENTNLKTQEANSVSADIQLKDNIDKNLKFEPRTLFISNSEGSILGNLTIDFCNKTNNLQKISLDYPFGVSTNYNSKEGILFFKDNNVSIKISNLSNKNLNDIITGNGSDLNLLLSDSKSGKTKNITINIKSLGFLRANDGKLENKERILIQLLQIINSIKNLSDDVRSDLMANVSKITIKDMFNAGEAHNKKIKEDEIALNPSYGIQDHVLTHEIGHSIDGLDAYHFLSDDKDVKSFIEQMKKTRFRSTYALSDNKELFAEWYAYKNGIKSLSYDFFEYLEQSKHDQWKVIENKLENILKISNIMNTSVANEEQLKELEDFAQQINNAEFHNEDTKLLINNMKNVLKSYNVNVDNIDKDNNTQGFNSLELFAMFRNHEDFKDEIDKLISKFKNNPVKKGLDYIEAIENIKNTYPKYGYEVPNIKLLSNDQLFNLHKDPKLLEKIKESIRYEDLPDSFKNKFKDAETMDLTKDEFNVIIRLPNPIDYIVELIDKNK